MPSDFANELYGCRTGRRLSAYGIAKELDITARYVLDVEDGSLPPPADEWLIRAWAEVLGIDGDRLWMMAGKARPSIDPLGDLMRLIGTDDIPEAIRRVSFWKAISVQFEDERSINRNALTIQLNQAGGGWTDRT